MTHVRQKPKALGARKMTPGFARTRVSHGTLQWAIDGVREETGLDLRLNGLGIFLRRTMLYEADTFDELFSFLIGLARGRAMVKR